MNTTLRQAVSAVTSVVTSLMTLVVIIGAVLTGCSLDSIVKVDAPQVGTDIEHDYLETKAGSLALLYSVLGSLQDGVNQTAQHVGYITDELMSRPPLGGDGNLGDYSSDTRFEAVDRLGFTGLQLPSYPQLQATRIRAAHARYFLRRQNDTTLNYAISAAYSYEGYALTMLAENLCSGIPLSEAAYGQDVVYGRGVPTDSAFRIAVAKFDSALALAGDSTRFKTLAKVGKARALVSLGRYREAADAVANVEQSDVFNLSYTETITPKPDAPFPSADDAFWTSANVIGGRPYNASEIVNLEGRNGLIWYANPAKLDPRLPVTVNVNDTVFTFPLVVRQLKYPNGNVTFRLAEWVETKLIEAEALLDASDPNWINPLNEARRSVGLADTTAPTTNAQRVDLLFRERAFWFYGQGTRLSDMRRLVRQYGRSVNTVYPIGPYTRSNEVFSYGDATVFIPWANEFVENYNYTGCINKNP